MSCNLPIESSYTSHVKCEFWPNTIPDGINDSHAQAHREGGVAGASAPGPGGPKGPLKKIKLV